MERLILKNWLLAIAAGIVRCDLKDDNFSSTKSDVTVTLPTFDG